MGALLVLSACANVSTLPPPEPPPRAQKSRSQATPKQTQEDPPELVAPPPAYGNKVVLASDTRPTKL